MLLSMGYSRTDCFAKHLTYQSFKRRSRKLHRSLKDALRGG